MRSTRDPVGIRGSGFGIRGLRPLVSAAAVAIGCLASIASADHPSRGQAADRTRIDAQSHHTKMLVPELSVQRLAFCPGGQQLAVVTSEGTMFLVAWPGGSSRRYDPAPAKARLPPCAATSAGFSPDGRWFAAPGNGDISIFDGDSGAVSRQLNGHLGTVNSVAFSPDGERLASVGADNDVRIWDMRTGQCVTTITTLTHGAFAVVWAPDGRRFYTGGASRTVTEWDAATGRRLRESSPGPYPIGELALSPDGQHLAVGSFNATGFNRAARLAMLRTAGLDEERVIDSPGGGVVGLTFAPDGRSVLWAASNAPGIAVWPID